MRRWECRPIGAPRGQRAICPASRQIGEEPFGRTGEHVIGTGDREKNKEQVADYEGGHDGQYEMPHSVQIPLPGEIESRCSDDEIVGEVCSMKNCGQEDARYPLPPLTTHLHSEDELFPMLHCEVV